MQVNQTTQTTSNNRSGSRGSSGNRRLQQDHSGRLHHALASMCRHAPASTPARSHGSPVLFRSSRFERWAIVESTTLHQAGPPWATLYHPGKGPSPSVRALFCSRLRSINHAPFPSNLQCAQAVLCALPTIRTEEVGIQTGRAVLPTVPSSWS